MRERFAVGFQIPRGTNGRRPVYLSGKPQPTLSHVHERELAYRVGHRAGRLDALLRPRSELIAIHLIAPQDRAALNWVRHNGPQQRVASVQY